MSGESAMMLGGFALAFIISTVLTGSLLRIIPRLGLIDQPSAQRHHTIPTPRGGGLAIFVAVLLTTALFYPAWTRGTWIGLGIGLGIVLLGLFDDFRSIPWPWRLGLQTILAAVYLFLNPVPGGWLFEVAALFWIVGLVNAFNMLDNIDALSAGIAWIVAASLAAMFLVGPANDCAAFSNAFPLIAVMGGAAGFLRFNRPPAKIFMGDAGSTFLGFILSSRSLELCRFNPERAPVWWVLPFALAVPWYDLITVVILRLRQGKSPFQGDTQHLSHRLVKLGLSSQGAVGAIYVLALTNALGSMALYLALNSRNWLMAVLLSSGLICWWVGIALVEYLPKLRGRG
jgi:UDP-GlcNAc:undecaprenyl-phosphate GlcNAc-1-phosphate transferase